MMFVVISYVFRPLGRQAAHMQMMQMRDELDMLTQAASEAAGFGRSTHGLKGRFLGGSEWSSG